MTLLQLNQIEKSKGNTIIFPQIDLTIRQGEAVAIQCNGAIGNSLIMTMIGEMPASNGEVLLENTVLNRNFKRLAHQIGLYLLNDPLYERLTPKEYLNFYRKLYDQEVDIKFIIHQVGLTEKANVKIGRLSYSEQKRLQLARVILHKPQLLIMEEPDQNIDVESKIVLQRILEEYVAQGNAALITTSNFESAISMTSHVYRLNEAGLKKIEVLDEESQSGQSPLIEESASLVNADNAVGETPLNQTEGEKMEAATQEDLQSVGEVHRPLQFDKIPVKVNDKTILFDPTEINFVESNEGISHLHVNGEVFPCAITLAELTKWLQPFGFFRCHRSYIVNLQKVREVITWTRNSYSLILEDANKSTIPLSKGKLQELKDIIGM